MISRQNQLFTSKEKFKNSLNGLLQRNIVFSGYIKNYSFRFKTSPGDRLAEPYEFVRQEASSNVSTQPTTDRSEE